MSKDAMRPIHPLLELLGNIAAQGIVGLDQHIPSPEGRDRRGIERLELVTLGVRDQETPWELPRKLDQRRPVAFLTELDPVDDVVGPRHLEEGPHASRIDVECEYPRARTAHGEPGGIVALRGADID